MKDGEPNYELEGELTIKGATHPLKFGAILNITDKKVTATSTLKFDRSKYNVKYNSASFFSDLGDKIIEDNVQMTVSFTATK